MIHGKLQPIMATGPLVSVVMPSFNQAAFIGAAAESVLQQHANLELIVADGGSTDGTLRVLERLTSEYGARLKWYSEGDDGAADAINKALQRAKGEIIGWLNSDDLYAPGAVQRAVAHFEERPETMMVYGMGEHIDEAGNSKGPYPTVPPPLNADVFRNSCPICQPTVFFRREMLGQVGMLDATLSVSFDYDLWIRVWKRYPHQIGFINTVQAYSRLHADCKTLRQRQDVALESMRVIARGFESAPPHWFYTWLDEYFSDFPHGGQPADARAAMRVATDEARGYLAEADRATFDRRIEHDARLRLMHDDASVTVYPDGWASSECVVRVRSVKCGYRSVRLACRHAAPKGGRLTIHVDGPEGTRSQSSISQLGSFSLDLDLPSVHTRPAFWSFMIKTDGAFAPSRDEPNSSDNRMLAFLVDGVELEQETVSCS